MAEQSFLFAPDISGFTNFVNETEIDHSQHIISEILELLIDENRLEMKISEIEGDSIIFYKPKEIPTYEQLQDQVNRMFTRFHQFINDFEHQRICKCGACVGAIDLKLKFFAHAGKLGYIKVKEFNKPHGADMVVLHRIMKNSVPSKEYLLATKTYMDLAQTLPKADQTETKEEFEGIGEQTYYWSLLDATRIVYDVPEEKNYLKTKKPISMSIDIEAPLSYVYEILSNFKHRTKWNTTLDDLKYDEGVNRVGKKHFCVIGNRSVELETIKEKSTEKDSMVYGESLISIPPFLKELNSFYVLKPINDSSFTRVEVIVHAIPKLWIFTPLLLFLRMSFMKNLKETLHNLKKLSENNETS